ncbi:MAG: hypothetical protein HQ525_07900 [Anaerolineae bacterium]|nr:hypothetical protein [Anaerolineae bacterium]
MPKTTIKATNTNFLNILNLLLAHIYISLLKMVVDQQFGDSSWADDREGSRLYSTE